MTDNKDKLIAELVNKGLDGDMDAVNACEDRMIRAKAKAMIVKVGKGTAERPPMPVSDAPAPATSGPVDISTLSKEDMLFYFCLLYTSPSPRDLSTSRMPSSA